MQLKKKSKLVDQLNEAEILHQNTDRRASQVRSLLGKYLDEPDLREYDTFLVHLIKHITDLKETEQRIKLGEEQLVAAPRQRVRGRVRQLGAHPGRARSDRWSHCPQPWRSACV